MATCSICNAETFRYAVVEGHNVCGRCPQTRRVAHNTFPFVAEHLEGKPVINSLYHLRQVERQHGVESVAYNMDSARHNQPTQQKTARERIPFLQKGRSDPRDRPAYCRPYSGRTA